MGIELYAAEFEKFSKVNEVYHYTGSTILKNIKRSVVILVQIDEKLDKAYVVDLMGLNNPWFNRLTTILNLNPVGKFFDLTEEGRDYYYSSSVKRKFKRDLYSFTGGQIPAWACHSIEILFGIKDIYTLGINYNSYPIGTIMVFPRGEGKIDDFPEIEEFVALASKYLYKILIDNKKRLRIPEIKDDITQSLIRNISHEIRTPLNAILGMMQISDQTDLTDEIKTNFAKNVWNSAYQLTHTIENLILLSELETNTVEFHFKIAREPLVPSVIDATIEDILKLYPGRHFHSNCGQVNVNNNPPKAVFVDKNRLKHAFTELLDNAFKFSETDIEIHYELADKITVQVKDFGIGISAEEQQHIFENFTRLESPERIYRGTGMGLSIASQIIQKHNGTLAVRSEPDKGSIFIVELPFYN